ncbi:hypothetical protein ACFOOM_12135 [Streptomyces echinoruber]|uniref:Uncharacterized protein n=1 Tax=Streptomyces echinoruber TaxID=68898 RepID=A0A918RJR6_9ACTN|nr:hypothetical protein [Streptomyces echinoruber]GHA01471.1 hypothetical protein GCM10010389_46050 [Streptomyces echinoruber]
MRIIGLLSWYEEPASWLAECVASAAKLCDHLIAIDGPYALFPGSTRRPASGSEQADTIARTAAGAGIGCTIHVPRQPWWGGEVEKRDFMFRLAAPMTTAADWLLRIDADEVLTDVPPDTRELLAASRLDVAEVTIWDRDDGSQHPFRCLFRALPGLAIEQAHYVVTAPGEHGKRVLVGNSTVHTPEPAEALWDVRLEHRTRQRPQHRQQQKQRYYKEVADLGCEQVAEIR